MAVGVCLVAREISFFSRISYEFSFTGGDRNHFRGHRSEPSGFFRQSPSGVFCWAAFFFRKNILVFPFFGGKLTTLEKGVTVQVPFSLGAPRLGPDSGRRTFQGVRCARLTIVGICTTCAEISIYWSQSTDLPRHLRKGKRKDTKRSTDEYQHLLICVRR